MEVAINQLECQFTTAVNDIDYVERKLRSIFARNIDEDVGDKANVVRLMERISSVKTGVESLIQNMALIADEKQVMKTFMEEFIANTTTPLHSVCQRAGLEVNDTEAHLLDGNGLKNLEASAMLSTSMASSSGACNVDSVSNTPMKEMTSAEANPRARTPAPVAMEQHFDQAPVNETGFVSISMKDFKKVPAGLRKGVTLAEMNEAHEILFEHFVIKNNRRALSKAQIRRKEIENAAYVLPCLQALELYRVTPTGSVAMAK